MINQSIPYQAPPPANPQVREYTKPPNDQTDYSPVMYLIALKNNAILAALTYWTDHGELYYVNLQHETKQVPLRSVGVKKFEPAAEPAAACEFSFAVVEARRAVGGAVAQVGPSRVFDSSPFEILLS